LRSALLGLIVVWAGCALALAQGSGTAPSSQPSRVVGVVTQLQPGSFTLHSDAGPDLLVLLSDTLSVLRVPPGATNLNTATKITISDVSPGDRVLVRGRLSDDQKTISATSVIVMTKTDLASAREAERLEWQQRGIGGAVTAVNPEAKEITIAIPTAPPTPANPTHPQTITLAANAILLRYAPDSVKFSDAKPSTLEEIKVGDQVRSLGAKTEEGSRFVAEKLVSGTFRNRGVTVLSVDAQNRAMTVKDLASGQTILVRTNADSALYRLPPNLAQMLATPNSGGGTSDFQQLLERTPALALGELKAGDPLVVVSTEGAKPAEVTAILVLAGVEPILAARPKGSNQVNLGPWSLGMGGTEGAP
jgi:hypothetical protein